MRDEAYHLRPQTGRTQQRREIGMSQDQGSRTVRDSMGEMQVPATALHYSPEEVASQRSGWISQWQRAVSR